jgi:hypothetical protein
MSFWNSTWEAMTTIAGLIIAVALLALIVSKKSNTAAVIQSAATGFSSALAVAIAPVTGAVPNANLAYPGQQAGIGGMTNAGIGAYQ